MLSVKAEVPVTIPVEFNESERSIAVRQFFDVAVCKIFALRETYQKIAYKVVTNPAVKTCLAAQFRYPASHIEWCAAGISAVCEYAV